MSVVAVVVAGAGVVVVVGAVVVVVVEVVGAVVVVVVVGGGVPAPTTAVELSAVTSAALRARPYQRTSSMRPLKKSAFVPPDGQAPICSAAVEVPLIVAATEAAGCPSTNARRLAPSDVTARCTQRPAGSPTPRSMSRVPSKKNSLPFMR